jgi:sulfur carrier protein
MINVTVNGRPAEVPADATVASVVATLELPAEGRGVAVAVDREVVPRGAWDRTALVEGARVEVVHAVQGG